MLLTVLKDQCSADDATNILITNQIIAVNYDVMSYEKIISKASAFDDLIKKSIAAKLNEILEDAV